VTDDALRRTVRELVTKVANLQREVTALKERRNYNEDPPVAHNSGMRQVKDPVLAGITKPKSFIALD